MATTNKQRKANRQRREALEKRVPKYHSYTVEGKKVSRNAFLKAWQTATQMSKMFDKQKKTNQVVPF